MNFHLNEEQNILKESFSKFLKKESTMAKVRAAEPLGFDPVLWAGLVGMEAHLMRVPDESGAARSSLFDVTLVAEEMGRNLACVPWLETLTASALLSRGDNDTARQWLERIQKGTAIVTLALMDVRRRPIQIVPAGAIADAVLVLDGDRIAIVEASGEAGSNRQAAVLPNLGGLPVARMDFSAVSGGRGGVTIASGSQARQAFLAAIEEWKLLAAAMLNAMARQSLEAAARYASERSAFGRLIGSYQGLAHPMADSVTDIDGGRLLIWRALWALSRGKKNAAAMISMAYWWAATSSATALTHAMRAFGGYGMTVDYDAQLYFRRGRSLALLLGDPQDELRVVGDRLWCKSTEVSMPEVGALDVDFDFGPEVSALIDKMRRFLRNNVTGELEQFSHVTPDGYHQGMQRKMAAEGLLFPDWPAEYGGQGLGNYAWPAIRSVFAEFAWPQPPITVTYMVGSIIMKFGSPTAKAEILPQLVSGEANCCLGYSEPSGGSDVFAAKTRAVRDGDDWIITGQKMFTSQGHFSRYCLLIARTDPEAAKHGGLTLFIVPTDLPGFSVHGIRTFADERTNITYYENMRVPDRYRLGEINFGVKVMAAALTLEHSGVSLYYAAMGRLVNSAVAWAQEADRNGGKAIDDPEVRLRLARALTHAEVLHALGQRSIWAGVEGQHGPFGSMAKLFGSESWLACSVELMNMAAPESILQDGDALGRLELESRRAVPGTIYAGTSEVHRSIIAENALGMPRSRH